MRFGIFDHNDDAGVPATQQFEERLRLLETYDRLGFRTYHMAEHHGTPLGLTPSPHLFLAAASQRTTRLRLGTLITVLPLYHPVRLIEEVCTLDHLTGGRLDLGVGRGASAIETGFHEVAGDETPDRFAEILEIMKLGLTSETLEYHGRFHDLGGVPMVIRPVQRPHPPMWFGAKTPERARWAARQGLSIMALLTSDKVRPITEAYRDEWAARGDGLAEPPIGINRHVVLAETDEEAMAVAERAFARLLHSFELLWHDHGVPVPPVLPARTFGDMHRMGYAYAGRPEGAKEFIEREQELSGVTYMALDMAFGDMTHDEATRTAELFAADVMPSFA